MRLNQYQSERVKVTNTKLLKANSRHTSSLPTTMSVIPSSNCIKCSFGSTNKRSPVLPSGEIEVFYGITKDLSSLIPEFETYLSCDEKLRAGKFHFIEDRNTYIACHGMLRMMLSEKLNIEPVDIIIVNDKNNKPFIIGNPIYFNITHVRDAFAFVVSKDFYVGIDIEKASRDINYLSIINSFFSPKERDYMIKSETGFRDRFFLLWTRKEALLKALGAGIVVDLKCIEVSVNSNKISRKSFNDYLTCSISNDHFIYSEKLSEYFLSVAVPQKTKIVMTQIDEMSLNPY